MPMTSEAKRELSSTIRAIRSRLLLDLHDSAESAYRLAVHEREAGLSEAARAKRRRLDDWIKEQGRAESGRGQAKRTTDDIRRDAEKQAAYTLLNRLVFLRLLEASGLRKPFVVIGGWESSGYKDFRSLAPALVRDDVTEGYDFLLRLVFEDLALDLPGLFGHAGVAELIPVPRIDASLHRRLLGLAIARILLDRRHDAWMGLPVLERPGAGRPRQEAQRGRKTRPARNRQQDADVH